MIKIRFHKRSDISYRVAWFNNPNANKYIGEFLGEKTTFKKQKIWFKNYLKDKNKKFFTICYNKLPIGFMGLSRINRINRNADMFIIIGDDKYRGRGFGKIAAQYLVNYGFKKLGLHKINLGVFEKNKQAISLYKKLGFITEGILKDEAFFAGEYHNQILMAIFNKNK